MLFAQIPPQIVSSGIVRWGSCPRRRTILEWISAVWFLHGLCEFNKYVSVFSAYLTYLLNSQRPCSILFESSVRWGSCPRRRTILEWISAEWFLHGLCEFNKYVSVFSAYLTYLLNSQRPFFYID